MSINVLAPRHRPPIRSRAGILVAILIGTLLVHALWAASKKVTCDDLWWDLAAGRAIVESGRIPAGDLFSYTFPGAPWHNGEWLANVFFYGLYLMGGTTALALSKFAFIVVVFAVVAWTAWRRSDSFVLAIGATVLATYLCRPYFDIRSQLFQFINVTVAMAVLEAYRRGARDRVLLVLPVVAALWANLHYSFIYGCGLLGLYAASELVKSLLGLPDRPLPRARALRLSAAVAVSLVAALANPYGIGAYTFPFELVGEQSLWKEDVLEWHPPVLFVEGDFNPAILGYVLVLQLGAAAAALVVDRRRFDLTDVALVAVTTGFAFSSRRFVPLFAVVATPFLAKNLAVLRDRFLPRAEGTPELARPAAAVAVGAAALALTAALFYRAVPEWKQTYAPGFFAGVSGLDYFPVGAVEFLHRNPLPARLFHPYTFGGYMMFHVPERKVFIDGRAQTIYHADFYAEEQTAENGRPGWNEVLEQRQVSVILWPSSMAHGPRLAALAKLLAASPSWVRVYDDGHSAVFAHAERGREWVDAYKSFALAYPEVDGAQQFLFNAYMNANDFDGAKRQIGPALRQFPRTREVVAQAEQTYAAAAQANGSASTWFALGFFRDLQGNDDGAAEAFREALRRGLANPSAVSYARRALERQPSP